MTIFEKVTEADNSDFNPSEPDQPVSGEEEIDFDEITSRHSHQPDVAEATEFSTIPIRNPKSDEFFRVNHDPEFTKQVNVIQYKTESEWYLIKDSVQKQLGYETSFKIMQLYYCLTRANTPFLTLIPLEDANGKMNSWHRSGHATMEIAKDFWIRRQAEQANGGYTHRKAKESVCPEPSWPKMTLNEIIKMAFQKDFYISRIDHPILIKLGH